MIMESKPVTTLILPHIRVLRKRYINPTILSDALEYKYYAYYVLCHYFESIYKFIGLL